MKRLLLLLPIIALLAFTSCSSDDNNNDNNKSAIYSDEDIIGTWHFVRTYVDGEDARDEDIYYPEYYEFQANGTLELYYDADDIDLAKWELNDDQLTISMGGETRTGDIIISKQNMSLFYKQDYYGTGTINNVEDQLKR